ncbi:MAG: DUF2156 domain-containing protein [Parachlamydiaceae bacterium]|nr:DUF2156 domain-containing protein [Parachlamydiaceae bacterium]
MEWKRLRLEDKPIIDQALREHPLRLSDYPFTNLWFWDIHRHYTIATVDGFLCIRFVDEKNKNSVFLYPIGSGSRKSLIEKLSESEARFRMRAVPEEGIAELQGLPLFIEAETAHFDYIYSYDDLLNLAGDHFQAKRNFIHQFEQKYLFQYKEISFSLLPKIIAAEEEWFNDHTNPNDGMRREHEATLRGLKDFEFLNVYGGAIIIDNKVVAYSVAEYISEEMLLIHIEKALKGYKGAYAMINQQMLLHLKPVSFVNREEDLGLDNLFKVKQSYHPIQLVKKFVISKT